MKYSEQWLQEWVQLPIDCNELKHRLTMAGFEVEACLPAALPFTHVVVGQLIDVLPHRSRCNLSVCTVHIGAATPLTIVCGADNVARGLKVAVAQCGAVLPGGELISARSFAGVQSAGMLCSAQELGLSALVSKLVTDPGILHLPDDAPLGVALWDYLMLSDTVWHIAVTPNRGDCLSMRGMAREIATLLSVPWLDRPLPQIAVTIADVIPVTVDCAACPHYFGRSITQISSTLATPLWLAERLRRAGISTISPVVDVTNYVMLECGQPLHAFDLASITQAIQVRYAREGEQLTLLDGRTCILQPDTVIIADHEQPLAIAGVMGGYASGIGAVTTAVFLESATFLPEVIAKQRQQYNIMSEAAYRFERGVDPTLQRYAIERATELILMLFGGSAGPIVEVVADTATATQQVVLVTHQEIVACLGIAIAKETIANLFTQLGFSYHETTEAVWLVTIPPYRRDIKLSRDLIEELARLYGYDNIPVAPVYELLTTTAPERVVRLDDQLRLALVYQGYHEIISYSFISQALQMLLDTKHKPLMLANPLTTDMQVMRTTLWGGLLHVLRYNLHHQQKCLRLFEMGACFLPNEQHVSYTEEQCLAGLVVGGTVQDCWEDKTFRQLDFFDIKGHVENLLDLFRGKREDFNYTVPTELSAALHPGRAAAINYQGHQIGLLGALHPKIFSVLDIPEMNVLLFELSLSRVFVLNLPIVTKHHAENIPKFPAIRRDIAILVDQAIPAQVIQDTIKQAAADLQKVCVFDVYQGGNIPAGLKSVALSLIFQHSQRTLTDEEIAIAMEQILATLQRVLAAVPRGGNDS